MVSYKRVLSSLLAAVMLAGAVPPAAFAVGPVQGGYQAPTHDTIIGDIAAGRYSSGKNDGERLEGSPVDHTEFIKITHPYTPGSAMKFDPTKSTAFRAEHKKEVFADGIMDYIGNGQVGVPGMDPGANGQGDRGQGYCWSALADGDWMYTCLLYNSAGSTSDVMEEPINPQEVDEMYGGDYWMVEDDRDVPYSAFVKINVKTGEVRHLMSEGKNGINAQFRGAAKYKGKLYFIGSVNHLPSIYEIDPKTDAFQCVHQDEEMRNHPGGWKGAWMESRGKGICPTIRGITTFTNPADGEEYLVISCVGMDGNPYIAISNDPSSGDFHKIGKTFADDYDIKYNPNAGPAELFGYAACDLRDSIMGGSIWEMAAIGNKLFVAICTGKPSNAKWHYRENEQEGDATGEFMTNQIIDSMQSFAIVVGEYNKDAGSPEEKGAWEWHSLAGDEQFDSKYTFGIDPERTRAGACNLNVFDGKLYVGEYNDTQIAFKNMANREYTFLKRNIEQSVSLYRLDPVTETFEKVMGNPTKMFPTALSGINESGFGKGENQYFWRSILFDGNGDGKDELYYGTFDETFVLLPIARMANEKQQGILSGLLDKIMGFSALSERAEMLTAEDDRAEAQLIAQLLDAAETVEADKAAGVYLPKADRKAADEGVLLPEKVMEEEPLVKVDSVKELYHAILAAVELIRSNQGDHTVSERLVNIVRVLNLQEEIDNYLTAHRAEIPDFLLPAAELLAEREEMSAEGMPQPPVDPEGPGRTEDYKEVKVVLQHLAGSVTGFDMFRTDDGVHFTQITRNGMGDPYNQGLRVFAANNDPENAWMCLGTANPFYGAQVWRMESGISNEKPVEPAQEVVSLHFVDEDGRPVERKPVDDHKAREISVPVGSTQVELESIKHLMLDSYSVSGAMKSVEIKTAGDGSKYIEIPLLRADQQVEVTISFRPVTGEQAMEKVVSIHASKTSLQAGELASYLAETTDQWLLENDHAGVTIKQGKATVNVVSAKEMYTMKLVGGVLSDNVSSEKQYAPGQIISIRATNRNPKMVFDHWDIQGNLPADEVKKDITSFVMPASDITLTSVYRELEMRELKVKNGIALLGKKEGAIIVPALDENGNEIPVTQAHKGQFIVIRTDPARDAPTDRQTFVKWTYKNDYASGVILDDATRCQTYFTMPDKNVDLTANYKNVHNVQVTGGEARVAGGAFGSTVQAYPGQGVTLQAREPEGKRFLKWEFSPEKVSSKMIVDKNQPVTSFVMPKFDLMGLFGTQNLKVRAVFVDAGQYLITLKNAYGPMTGSTVLSAGNGVVPALTEPKQAGKYFVGWFTEKNGGEQIKAGDRIDRDLTLYAHWSKTAPETSVKFTDVPKDAWFAESVYWAAKNGITSGVGPDLFGPYAVCTRAQAVTFLWRSFGSPAPVSKENPFKDVREEDYFYQAVLWAVENGITAGIDGETFAPDVICSRAQIVTFLWAAEGRPQGADRSPFVDVPADAWYAEAVNWAAESGVTAGVDASHFSPDSDCTRAEIVTFLHKDFMNR